MLRVGLLSKSENIANNLMLTLTVKDVFGHFNNNMSGIDYIPISLENNLRGFNLDQLIIVNEDLMSTDYYTHVLKPSLSLSCVPDEYVIQIYQ